jgi:hypothetical protein
MRRILPLLAAVMAAASCSGGFSTDQSGGGGGGSGQGGGPTLPPGGVPTPPPGTPAGDCFAGAKAYFDGSVKAMFGACQACHIGQTPPDPQFGTSLEDVYVTLKGNNRYYAAPGASLLLSHHHTGAGIDPSPGFVANLTMWLMQEQICATTPPPGVPPVVMPPVVMPPVGPVATQPTSANAAIVLFGRCMALSDFVAANVVAISNQGTTSGRCTSCHTQGAGDAWLSTNPQDMFNNWTMQPYLDKFALPRRTPDGTYDMILSTRLRDKGQDQGTHPSYIMDAGRWNAVQTFFNASHQRFATGNCNGDPGVDPNSGNTF